MSQTNWADIDDSYSDSDSEEIRLSEDENELDLSDNESEISKPLSSIKKTCGIDNVEFYSDLTQEKDYEHGYWRKISKENIVIKHLGQKKLFLTELWFLTNYGHLSNTVVYPGAAHGYHIPLLAALFPTHKFYLYDPAYFFKGIESYERIKVFNQYFLEEDAKKLEYENALLISDIRTLESEEELKQRNVTKYEAAKIVGIQLRFNTELNNSVSSLLNKDDRIIFKNLDLSKSNLPNIQAFLIEKIDDESLITLQSDLKIVTEKSVINDMELQAQFIKNMKPVKALLKFRVPYLDDLFCKNQINQDNTQCYFAYYKGELLLQPYAPISSTEMRLITDSSSDTEFKYNCGEIEKRLFYYNTNIRNTLIDVNGINMSWDQIQECAIIQQFKQKFPIYENWNIVEYISNIVKSPLKFFEKLNIKEQTPQQTILESPEEITEVILTTLSEDYLNILNNKELTSFVLDWIDELVETCCLFLQYIIKAREGYWRINRENVSYTGYPSIGGTLINYVIKNILNIEYIKTPTINVLINPILTEYLKSRNVDFKNASDLYSIIFSSKMSSDLKIKLTEIFDGSEIIYLKDSAYEPFKNFIIYMVNEVLYSSDDITNFSIVNENIQMYNLKEGSNTFYPKDYGFIQDSDNIITQSFVWIICGLNDWLEKDSIDTEDILTLNKILEKNTSNLFISSYSDEEELFNIKEKLKNAMFYNNFFISEAALDKLTIMFINLHNEYLSNPESYIIQRIKRFSVII